MASFALLHCSSGVPPSNAVRPVHAAMSIHIISCMFLLQVRQEQASLKASLAEFGEQVRQLQAQMVQTASAEGEPGG